MIFMPHFHTHVCFEDEFARDEEGQQFADLEKACERARQSARRMISQMIGAGRNAVDLRYVIHDEEGLHLATIRAGARVSGLD